MMSKPIPDSVETEFASAYRTQLVASRVRLIIAAAIALVIIGAAARFLL